METPSVMGLVGMGSIGRRHAECLRSLGIDRLYALRSGKGLKSCHGFDFVTDVRTFDELTEHNPAGVVVANPTAIHSETALPFLKSGIPVLIEKPVDSSVVKANRLLASRDDVKVAYCMRFHPLFKKLGQLLADGAIGQPYKVSVRRGYYLPSWHVQMDYRREYAALRSLGGGVLRTLSHELDMVVKLFGRIERVVGSTDKVSELELDVEDCAFFSCRTATGVRAVFDIDFLCPENRNELEIIGVAGMIRTDFTRNTTDVFGKDGTKKLSWQSPADSLAVMYMQQMQDFLGFIATGNSANATVEEAIHEVQVMEAVEATTEVSL
jgi:predicted dehydrogenase